MALLLRSSVAAVMIEAVHAQVSFVAAKFTPDLSAYLNSFEATAPMVKSALMICSWLGHADKQVPDTWRVANENDLVAKIPSLLGYRHVGIEAKITAAGHIHVARVSFDQVREGAVFSDIMPRIKGEQGSHQALPRDWLGALIVTERQ